MKKKLSKTEACEKIKNFFLEIKGKNPEQIKKIKRLAMHHHISLRPWKRLFCKKCSSIFSVSNSDVRIKNGLKTIKCKKCGFISGYSLAR
jgi:predicted Zn finger-like uncharacterized protein